MQLSDKEHACVHSVSGCVFHFIIQKSDASQSKIA